jgi:hypothetical protein
VNYTAPTYTNVVDTTTGIGLKVSDGTGGIIWSTDMNHSIWLRMGRDGTVDTTNYYQYGAHRFYTGGTIQAQSLRMIINSSGLVGIGTTNPGFKFEVNGSMSQGGGNAYLAYDTTSQIFLGSNRTGAFVRFNDDMWFGDSQNGVIQVLNGAGGQWGTLQGYFTNMSTRASKKDVTTFDQTKLESLYQDTIKTKVCSWRYKEEADYVPLKYGPILDDSPPYFTVTPDGESLYINQYVAMLHGALQVAIQKIESLETRLSTLENNTTQ